MLQSQDNKNFRRDGSSGTSPYVTGKRMRGIYTATGGETMLNTLTQLVGDKFNFIPGFNQLDIVRINGDIVSLVGETVHELAGNYLKFDTALQAGEKVMVTKSLEVNVLNNPNELVQKVHSADLTAGQTEVSLPFSYPHSQNLEGNIGALIVILDGKIVDRNSYNEQSASGDGIYYEPTDEGTYTNKIKFTTGSVPLAASLSVLMLGTFDLTKVQETFIDKQLYKLEAWYTCIVGNSPNANYSDLQDAIDYVDSLGGGKILVVDDLTSTGFSIPASANNITIESLNLNKITKSGTTSNSKAFEFGANCNRIVIKGFELVNWDESGDYVFYANSGVDKLFVMNNYLNSYTNGHNFAGVVTNYIFNNNLI